MNLITKENRFTIQGILEKLSEQGHQILVIYHSLCREDTIRILSYKDFRAPQDRAIFDYTVDARDMTHLFQGNNVSIHSIAMIDSLKVQIESLPYRRYKFSADYSFELIVNT